MAVVYLALGSNLTDRKSNIRQAIELLKSNKINIIESAKLIETNPVGGPPQDPFLNTVIKIETDLTPHELLSLTQSIEKHLGRSKTVVNGPRTIDIDILLYDQISLQTNQLTIPHPRMLKRDFVLNPLKEIAPELVDKLTHAWN